MNNSKYVELFERCGYVKTEYPDRVELSDGLCITYRVNKANNLKTAERLVKGKPTAMTETDLLVCLGLLEQEAEK